VIDGPIFHLALEREWREAEATGEYRRSTRGRSLDEVGFVHCSFAEQVPTIGAAFYADAAEPLVLLEIDPARVGSDVRVEPAADGADALFPHVYGPIPLHAVVAAHPISGDGPSPWRW
jgi:glutathione S-transferase